MPSTEAAGRRGARAARTRQPFRSRPRGRRAGAASSEALLATTVLAIALALWGWLRPRPRLPPARLAVAIPADERISQLADPGSALSADGQLLVYNADLGGVTHLFARRLSDVTSTVIPGTEGANAPVLSPDGNWLAFESAVAGSAWKKMPAQGGAAVEIPVPPGTGAPRLALEREGWLCRHAGLAASWRCFMRPAPSTRSPRATPVVTNRASRSWTCCRTATSSSVGTDIWPAGHLIIIDRATGKRTELLDDSAVSGPQPPTAISSGPTRSACSMPRRSTAST